MTRFRPCIDLHSGQVKQIVGGTLNTTSDSDLKTNHVSTHSAGYFANLYRAHDCHGAHVIMLGPGNDEAAREALAAWPGGLQLGGGITDQNAREWIERGAEKVIVSYRFPDRGAATPSVVRCRWDAFDFSQINDIELKVGYHNFLSISRRPCLASTSRKSPRSP